MSNNNKLNKINKEYENNNDDEKIIIKILIVGEVSVGKSNFIYRGPVDSKNKGFPILTKGFFNTKCNPNPIKFDYSKKMYNFYFDSWDYDYSSWDSDW